MNAKKVVPVILSVVGSAGVVGTGYLAFRAGQKNPTKPLPVEGETKFKYFIRTLKPYIPTIAVGTATIASITASTIISKKIEASLSATVLMLEQGYKKYKGKAQKLLNDIAEDKGYPPAKDEKKLYHNEYLGFFYADPLRLERAYNCMNMRLNSTNVDCNVDDELMGWYSLDDFIKDGELELVDDTYYNEHWKGYGWCTEYLCDTSNDCWVFTRERDNTLDDEPANEPYKVIIFDTDEPVFDPKYCQDIGLHHNDEIIKSYKEAIENDDYLEEVHAKQLVH